MRLDVNQIYDLLRHSVRLRRARSAAKSFATHSPRKRTSKARDLAIAAYDTADPNVRSNFDRLAVTMSVVLEANRVAMATGLWPDTIVALAQNVAGWLKPPIARAGVVINGEADASRVL